MLNEYKPTPQQIVEALKALGYEESFDTLDRPDGVPTEEDYPDLVGYLLAMAEVTSCNLISVRDSEGQGAIMEAYQSVFIPDPGDTEVSHEVMYHEYLIAVTETARRLHMLNDLPPFAAHGEMDHTLADTAALAAMLSGQVSNLRIGLGLALLDSDGEDAQFEVSKLVAQIPGLISESARLTAMLASFLNPNEHNHYHHDDVDLCDEHRQELDETLEGIKEATEEAQLPEESRRYYAALDRIRAAGGELAERLEARLAEDRRTAMEISLEADRTRDYTAVQAKHAEFTAFVFELEAQIEDEDPYGRPYKQHVVKDLGDDYDQVMGEFLNRMKAGGFIRDWEHQPHNGNGNGSIVLWGSKDGDYVMSYDEALEYARGFVDALDAIEKKDQ